VQVLLGGHPKGEMADARGSGAAQHQAVVIALLVPPQVEAITPLLALDEPQQIDVEGAGAPQIRDPELDVRGAQDVELRVARPEIDLRYHRKSGRPRGSRLRGGLAAPAPAPAAGG